MRILLQVFRSRLTQVAFHQFDLGDVRKCSVGVEQLDRGLHLLQGRSGQPAFLEMRRDAGRRVLLGHFRKPLVGVKTDDPPGVIDRLEDGRKLGEREQPRAMQHTTLDDRAVYVQDALEDLVADEKFREVLARGELRKRIDAVGNRSAGVHEHFLHHLELRQVGGRLELGFVK